jgi:hypothetical protein
MSVEKRGERDGQEYGKLYCSLKQWLKLCSGSLPEYRVGSDSSVSQLTGLTTRLGGRLIIIPAGWNRVVYMRRHPDLSGDSYLFSLSDESDGADV